MLSRFEHAVSKSFVPAAARAELLRIVPDLRQVQINAIVPTDNPSSIVVTGIGYAHRNQSDASTVTEAEFTFAARLKAKCSASKTECYRTDWLTIEGTIMTGKRV